MIRTPDGWTSAFLSASSSGSVDDRACAELVEQTADEDTVVLYVTFVQSPEERLETFREHGFDDCGARAEVIHVASGPARSAFGDASGSEEEPRVTTVPNPKDLPRLGLEIDKRIGQFPDDLSVEVCFHSLTALLRFVDPDDAFGFVQTLHGFLRSVDGRVHYHVDEDAGSVEGIETIRPLVDTVFEGESLVRAGAADASRSAPGSRVDPVPEPGAEPADDAAPPAEPSPVAEPRLRDDGPLPELEGGAGPDSAPAGEAPGVGAARGARAASVADGGPPPVCAAGDRIATSVRSRGLLTDPREWGFPGGERDAATRDLAGGSAPPDDPIAAAESDDEPEASGRGSPGRVGPTPDRAAGVPLLVAGVLLLVPGAQFPPAAAAVARLLGAVAGTLPGIGFGTVVRAAGLLVALLGAFLATEGLPWRAIHRRLPASLPRP